jgi:hypothetical protein
MHGWDDVDESKDKIANPVPCPLSGKIMSAEDLFHPSSFSLPI